MQLKIMLRFNDSDSEKLLKLANASGLTVGKWAKAQVVRSFSQLKPANVNTSIPAVVPTPKPKAAPSPFPLAPGVIIQADGTAVNSAGQKVNRFDGSVIDEEPAF